MSCEPFVATWDKAGCHSQYRSWTSDSPAIVAGLSLAILLLARTRRAERGKAEWAYPYLTMTVPFILSWYSQKYSSEARLSSASTNLGERSAEVGVDVDKQ